MVSMVKKRTLAQRIQHLQLVVLLAVTFTLGYTLGTQQSTASAQDAIQTTEEVFAPLFQAYELIQDQYINDIETDALVNGAIRGMVEELDDPYSNYVEPEFYEFVDSDLSGEIEGIGVVITETEDGEAIEILDVLEDSPASRSGIEVGDIFYEVDGENAFGMTFLELASRVRGRAGTTVNLTMQRGDDLVIFDVERARIVIPNVEYELLPGDIAYVQLQQFSSPAQEQLEAAFADLDVNARNGLVLDLRGNPGGFLSAAVNIAGLFIDEGTLLIEEFSDGRVETFVVEGGAAYRVDVDGNRSLYSSSATYADITVPIVVLVDERSASASELVSGAWQDNDVVTVIGTKTFGKGTVQIQNQLVNGGGMRLTIARWLTPSGVWISEQGVTPDIVVAPSDNGEDDTQLKAALEYIGSLNAE
jgi:carboxyl-terminal processing protease